MFKYQFRWDTVWGSFDFLMGGLEMTLIISAITLVLAMIGGLIIALLDMSRFRVLRWIGVSIGEIVRNTPILVQLLWVYYVLPIVFGALNDAVGIWSSCFMLLFVLVAAALAWMHFAIRRMERRHFPQIDRETDLPEAIDAAAAERVRGG